MHKWDPHYKQQLERTDNFLYDIYTRTREDSACFQLKKSPWQCIDNIEVLQMKEIGEGSNAKVFRAFYKEPETQATFIYAVKVYR